jgi:hypothetical protein
LGSLGQPQIKENGYPSKNLKISIIADSKDISHENILTRLLRVKHLNYDGLRKKNHQSISFLFNYYMIFMYLKRTYSSPTSLSILVSWFAMPNAKAAL